MEKMIINGEAYVKESDVKAASIVVNTDGLPYCVIRARSAGVFVGYVKRRDKADLTLLNARRIWFWDGAATLSELAMRGVKHPENCKFPCEVPTIDLTDVIEVIPATEEAKKSIDGVKVWTAWENEKES